MKNLQYQKKKKTEEESDSEERRRGRKRRSPVITSESWLAGKWQLNKYQPALQRLWRFGGWLTREKISSGFTGQTGSWSWSRLHSLSDRTSVTASLLFLCHVTLTFIREVFQNKTIQLMIVTFSGRQLFYRHIFITSWISTCFYLFITAKKHFIIHALKVSVTLSCNHPI